MRPIGFSTGALAKGDFERALRMLAPHRTTAIEFSALRASELDGLLAFVAAGNFPRFRHMAFHAPSRVAQDEELAIVEKLARLAPPDWPIVTHPDVVRTDDLWRQLGPRLCFENMDERKPMGRTCDEMGAVFERFPAATFCFDIGHAQQVDPSMSQASCLLQRFRDRLRQVHFSEVDSTSAHRSVGWLARNAFADVVALIPAETPIILEAVIGEAEIGRELQLARGVLRESQAAA